MFYNRSHALALLLSAGLFVPFASGGVIYDLRSEWSLASNPNGVWSYNQGSTPLPYTQAGWGGISETFWATTTSGTLPPAWARIDNSQGVANHWDLGSVVGHSTTPVAGAGPESLGAVWWTSPAAGVISVSGRAWDAYHYADRDDQWRLFINGIMVAARGSIHYIARNDPEALFANNLEAGQALDGWVVAAGDSVVFEIQSLTYAGHFVGVDLTVDLEPRQTGEIPEPSLALPVLAAIAAGAFVRRKRR